MRLMLLLCLFYAASMQAFGEVEKRWDFKVLLNGREVGSHSFVVSEEGGRRSVASSMSLDFRVLLVKHVSYQHKANEVWLDGCLTEVSSQTERSGKSSWVRATLDDTELSVTTKAGIEVFPGCVRSFAYWDPEWLRGENLLNVETGKNLAVNISRSQSTTDNITHITIATPTADIHLQYDTAGDWLSLQTKLPIAGELSYQRY